MKKITIVIIIILAFISCSRELNDQHGERIPRSQRTQGFQESLKAQNVVLFIGDGMGLSHIYASMTANNGTLYLEGCTHTGLLKTYSSNRYITDSGAGGTAMSSGVKTYNGAIGMNVNREPVKTILEYAEDHGLATGLISTSAITHATPASFISHQANRNDYEDIASDFLNTDIDLIIGGGRDHFNKRKNDDLDLIESLKSKGYHVLDRIPESTDLSHEKLACFTALMHNPSILDGRGDMLPEATRSALHFLSRNKKGFFIMIEGSHIDWAAHANNTEYIIAEMLDFDRAINEALNFAKSDKNTLVIVTADHETGGMTIHGGNFQDGTVEAAYTTDGHTGVMVPVFAYGPGAENFTGIYENTEIFKKMMAAFGFTAE